MPQDKVQVPPPRKLVSEFRYPSPAVVVFSELVQRSDPAYLQNAPISRGRLYSTIIGGNPDIVSAYPNLYFLKETRLGQSDQLVLWTWATVPEAEDTYNAEVQYAEDAVDYPGYARVYTIPRDVYDASAPIADGTPLTALIAIEVTDGGTGYTVDDIVQIDGVGTGATAHLNVDANGVITSVVIDNEGTGYTSVPTITVVSGTGAGAVLTGIIQSQSAVLVSQKKEEFPEGDERRNEFVRVIRIYETLPGPYLTTYRVDEDGKTITVKRRHQVQTVIDAIDPRETLSGGVWTRKTAEAVSSYIGWEVTEQRDIPGNAITETKLDEAGNIITVSKQMVQCSAITPSESVSGSHVWTKVYGQPISELVCWKITETLQLPGNLETSTKVDEDGKTITITKRLQELSLITTSEQISSGNWIRKFAEAVSDLVAQEVTESRPVPGNAIPSTTLDKYGNEVDSARTLKDKTTITTGETINGSGVWIRTTEKEVSDLVSYEIVEALQLPGNATTDIQIDKDGKDIAVAERLKDTSTIVTGEDDSGGFWTKTEKEAVSDLVAVEKVTSRAIPGNTLPSAKIGGDYEVETVQRILKQSSTITPSATENAGVITVVEKEEVNDLVSYEVTRTKDWLDEASYSISIADVIPEVFRAQIPTTTESHIHAGTASMPTLATHEFEHSQKQLNKLLYEERIVALNAPSLPVVVHNYGVTSRYGGNTTTTTLTLDTHGSLTADTGLMVLTSEVKDLGNGDDVKITDEGDNGTWPTITNKFFDEEMQVWNSEDRQVVDPTYTPTSGTYYVEQLKPIDEWKAWRIRVTRTPTAIDEESALESDIYAPFRFPGVLAYIGLVPYVRKGKAELTRQTIKTWWVSSASKPAIAVDDFGEESIIISTLNDITTLAYSSECLHDTITTFGVLFWPATTPSATDYNTSWKGFSKITKAVISQTEIPDLWKIVTTNIVMR